MSDEEYDEPMEMKAEASAYQRAGRVSVLHELLSIETLEKLNKPKGGGFQLFPPEDQFLLDVDRFARGLIDMGVDLSEGEIEAMLRKTTEIPNVRYFNATAYILGFLATKGGQNLLPSNIQAVINEVLPKVREERGVEPPDVVRYARYWTKSKNLA